MQRHYKIAICTVCMNRLYHLKETLPKNIKDNLDYPYLEHVILDYNSGDDMEAWVKEQFSPYIKTGRLKYYRTPDPQKFNMSHSKNMVSKLADGDIVCLVDADNYTGKGYAEYINRCFNKQDNIFITTIGKYKVRNTIDVLGRICFSKNDFLELRGFDEFMSSYGFDDYDFANRLTLLNKKRIVLHTKKYLNAITHSLNERVENQEVSKDFKQVFIHQINPAESELLYLFADQTFSIGIMKDNNASVALSFDYLLKNRKHKYDESLTTEDWLRGTWTEIDGVFHLNVNSKTQLTFKASNKQHDILISEKGNNYFKLTSKKLVLDLLLFHTMIRNRNKMAANLKQKKIVVNNAGFGAGRVFTNFDNELLVNV